MYIQDQPEPAIVWKIGMLQQVQGSWRWDLGENLWRLELVRNIMLDLEWQNLNPEKGCMEYNLENCPKLMDMAKLMMWYTSVCGIWGIYLN